MDTLFFNQTMNNLSKLLFFLVLAAVSITSCSKSDDNGTDWAEEQRIRDSINNARIEALLEEQAPILKDFAEEHIPGAVLDDSTGIWFKIHEPGEEESYIYRLVPSSTGGLALANPTVKVKYMGKLLNGDIFDETIERDSEKETFSSSIGSLILAWNYAFYPKTINYNVQDYKIGGITEKGLQKGAIIEFVAPSPYCYDNAVSENIPADSPLHFYIEVVDIK